MGTNTVMYWTICYYYMSICLICKRLYSAMERTFIENTEIVYKPNTLFNGVLWENSLNI